MCPLKTNNASLACRPKPEKYDDEGGDNCIKSFDFTDPVILLFMSSFFQKSNIRLCGKEFDETESYDYPLVPANTFKTLLSPSIRQNTELYMSATREAKSNIMNAV